MSVTVQLYDRARAALERSGLDADAQTKIALFVGAAKMVNATMLAPYVLQPAAGAAYPFIHEQYCRELEFASLLARVTRWSRNPLVYAQGASLVATLWTESWRILLAGAPLLEPRAAYATLALGHALLARVRLAPVLGKDVDELDPFVVAMRRIEQDGGRMIQTQIRLLKDERTPLETAERERIIEDEQALVDVAFARLLGWLDGHDPASGAAGPGDAGATRSSAEARAGDSQPDAAKAVAATTRRARHAASRTLQ